MISEDPNTPPTDKMEEVFIAAIMKEIDRVDTFFTFQENQFYAEFRSLCQKVLKSSEQIQLIHVKFHNMFVPRFQERIWRLHRRCATLSLIMIDT
jgi:beta-glucosidase/6-phospho-beta-glucosidase/beta-galactosidase